MTAPSKPSTNKTKIFHVFSKFSGRVSHASGHPAVFAIACMAVVVWAISGPIFSFSETWQLVINTGTTIVTFLMVFVLQNSQNRDGEAIQAKLDELIRVSAGTNRLIGAEHLNPEELEHIREVLEKATARHSAAAEAAGADHQPMEPAQKRRTLDPA